MDQSSLTWLALVEQTRYLGEEYSTRVERTEVQLGLRALRSD